MEDNIEFSAFWLQDSLVALSRNFYSSFCCLLADLGQKQLCAMCHCNLRACTSLLVTFMISWALSEGMLMMIARMKVLMGC